jgi:protein LTV1
MPRSKKKLIDRNASNAFTFRLVHRSQHDPRAADPEASKYVLHPLNMGAAASNMTLDPDELFGATAPDNDTAGSSSTPLSASADGTAEKTKQGKTKTKASGGGGGDAAAVEAEAKAEAALLRYGIYYDDGYDYMQHLREPGGANTEHVDADAAQMRKLASQANKEARLERLNLPEDVFPSAVEEKIGLLNRAAPNSDPRIDWDPDVVRLVGHAWERQEGVTLKTSADASNFASQ